MEDSEKRGLRSGSSGAKKLDGSRDLAQSNYFTFVSSIPGLNYKQNVVAVDDFSHKEKSFEKIENGPRKQSMSAEVKLYKRRYLMLFLFGVCSMMNGIPQFQYTVVADVIACYYDVSLSAVNWTSIAYMVVFLPLVFPVMYLMEKKGLKITLLIGGILNCLGSWVQCGSLSSDRYAIVMACQTIYSLGQVFVLSLPPYLAGVWFGAKEVGLACALGVFGNQLGIALGFIIPPILITNDCENEKAIAYQLGILAYPMAVANTLILVILVFVFQEKPPSFPSVAQATKKIDDTDYMKSLKTLFKDVPFVLLFLSYGLLTGVYFAMSTIMNEMVLIHFPGELDAGWLGAIMVFAGMGGSILLGISLDRTHKYKCISLFVFISSFALMVGYTFFIQLERIWIQYIFFTLLGFFMTGYLPAGFDFGAEITYPEKEAMSASLLNASTQIFSIIFTIISSYLLQEFGDFFSNIFFCGALLLATLTLVFIKCDLKRTHADSDAPDIKRQEFKEPPTVKITVGPK